MTDIRRRRLLQAGTGLAASATLGPAALWAMPEGPVLPTTGGAPTDATYWQAIARLYEKPAGIAMLENGYFGAMAQPVRLAYEETLRRVNRENAVYGRLQFPEDAKQATARVAQLLGAADDEVVLTRGATEALQALIGGYAKLRPGDGVLYADTDYDSMITAMRWLAQRRGAVVESIALPEPFDHDAIVECYAQAMRGRPRLRLLLLTQVSHRNGLRLPVERIAALARARGVDVILDAAHALGQMHVYPRVLGVDFIGINLHKWIGAPVGCGAMYIRRERLGAIEPFMGETPGARGIQSRVHTGTVNFAAWAVLPAVLDFHAQIGTARKQARLQWLRNRWVNAASALPGIQVLASTDPRLSSAIASFRLRGATTLQANVALAKRLMDKYGVFAVHRDGLASGACVRVTPSIATSEAEIDRLIAALQEESTVFSRTS